MSNKIFVLWSFIIVGILLSVLLIGLKEKDLKYLKLEYSVKLASRTYIKKNNIKIKINDSYIIFKEDLKNINNDDLEKYCIDNITYYNGIIFDKYTISKKCKK